MEITKELLEAYKAQNPTKYEQKFGLGGSRVEVAPTKETKKESTVEDLKETKTK